MFIFPIVFDRRKLSMLSSGKTRVSGYRIQSGFTSFRPLNSNFTRASLSPNMTRTVVSLLFVALAGCGQTDAPSNPGKSPPQAPPTPVPWDAVPTGVVLSRNLLSPANPEKEGFHLLPGRFRLGSKAFAKSPPAWWLDLAGKEGLEEKWKCSDFPLAYAGEVAMRSGRALLVVQVTHSFTGDGFFSPGPVLSLVAFLFSLEEGGARLVAEEKAALGAHSGGSFQFSRLQAGQAKEQNITFRMESGNSFDAGEITTTRELHLVVLPEGGLRWEQGPP
jgi:hypothetical protein